jgi:hypothetical protein
LFFSLIDSLFLILHIMQEMCADGLGCSHAQQLSLILIARLYRKRAEAAAQANRRLAMESAQKSEVARAWKKSEQQTLAKGASIDPTPAENFFGCV